MAGERTMNTRRRLPNPMEMGTVAGQHLDTHSGKPHHLEAVCSKEKKCAVDVSVLVNPNDTMYALFPAYVSRNIRPVKIRETLFGLVGKRVVLTLKDRNLIHSGPPFGTQQRGSGRLPSASEASALRASE
jgi:hypothetical protein